jgi:hypothetical protein
MAIDNLIYINGDEITEHGRTFESSEEISAEDIQLANGLSRRFYQNNKKQFQFSWTYLPSLQAKTVDSRKAQAYLVSLANTTAVVELKIKEKPTEDYVTYNCWVDSYSEELIRRDFSTQCSYYNVQLTLVEQ